LLQNLRCILFPDKEHRYAEIDRITDEVKGMGTEMLLLDKTLKAVRHAFQMGWINEHQLGKRGS
jgi:hypothetical protein